MKSISIFKKLLLMTAVSFSVSSSVFAIQNMETDLTCDNVSARTWSMGLNSLTERFCILQDDETIIIQMCLELPELQSYLPINSDKTLQQVHILQFPVVFKTYSALSKSGMPVLFQDRPQVKDLDAFISFSKFSISGSTAEVVYSITTNRNTSNPSTIKFSLKLEKIGSDWKIVE